MPLLNSNIPPIQQQQPGYLMQMNNINGNNPVLQDFDYQQHLSPLLMQQQQVMMLNNQQYNNTNNDRSSSSIKKFNVNTTRSNSSSSSNSSVLSALRTTNNISSLSSSPGSNITSNNTFGHHYDLLYVKNRSKLFEDDVLFCPRALLSQSELKTRDELDKFLMDKYYEYMIINGQQNLHLDERKNGSNGPKFNPYASKSFTPGN
ncbi:similar to Saccharomyces cerevisiae YPL229W Putative protein of unknown function [Maudiozyma saulgeensis]|uniref:Uncharacterized protein n=1 Tax=Maudiozyma saulgeensis TaxID=1789683 RepID=A0A1X7R024_9SACH|nr:similar to Saccharomyces cerevisiae YPL229W Putative protein of unknown function [Kazachstania saulgeensis]